MSSIDTGFERKPILTDIAVTPDGVSNLLPPWRQQLGMLLATSGLYTPHRDVSANTRSVVRRHPSYVR